MKTIEAQDVLKPGEMSDMNNSTTDESEMDSLSIPKMLLGHLLPGVPILLVAVLFSSPAVGIGLPFYLSLMIAIALGLIPVQMLILFTVAKRQGKKISEIIHFKEKMSGGKTILWALPLFLFAALVFTFLLPIEEPLWGIFDWLPEWFHITLESLKSRPALIIPTLVLDFLLNGFLGPIVEEIYFRGFLLPRMNNLGKWAPIVNAGLFSLYHFFSPWQNITRIVSLAPIVYTVWHKKNIRIGMFVHCSLNIISFVVGTLLAIL
jgi:membrane protease YdiL (CAAX protease family)